MEYSSQFSHLSAGQLGAMALVYSTEWIVILFTKHSPDACCYLCIRKVSVSEISSFTFLHFLTGMHKYKYSMSERGWHISNITILTVMLSSFPSLCGKISRCVCILHYQLVCLHNKTFYMFKKFSIMQIDDLTITRFFNERFRATAVMSTLNVIWNFFFFSTAVLMLNSLVALYMFAQAKLVMNC